jgi:hypothetical protein
MTDTQTPASGRSVSGRSVQARDTRFADEQNATAANAARQGQTARFPNPAPVPAGLRDVDSQGRRIDTRLPMHARFVVTDIMHTTRGVTVLYLKAQYDGNEPTQTRLAPGNSPVGNATIEVADDYALKYVAHGSVFYLSSL